MSLLASIARNPNARAPNQAGADETIPDQFGHPAKRWAMDDNGLLLTPDLRAELVKVVAEAMRGGTGKAFIITASDIALTANMSVPGYGGRARWASPNFGNTRGGYIFLASGAQAAAERIPATVSHFDPRKVILDEPQHVVRQRRVHIHHAPDVYIDHPPTHTRPLTLFGMRVR